MNDKQKRQYEVEKECNFVIAHPDRWRFRANAYLEQGKPVMVSRKINTKVPTFSDLKLPSVLAYVIMERKGLVLVVGQIGSGKSTTLEAMIDYRNKNTHGHILSIEDPVELPILIRAVLFPNVRSGLIQNHDIMQSNQHCIKHQMWCLLVRSGIMKLWSMHYSLLKLDTYVWQLSVQQILFRQLSG